METTMETTRALIHDVYLGYCEAKDELYKVCVRAVEEVLFRNSATLWVTDEAQADFGTDVTRVFHQPTYPYCLMCERDNREGAIFLHELPIEDLAAVAMIATNYKLKLKRY